MTFGISQHCHHDILFEFCYNLEERQRAIIITKPANELLLRLRLFRIYPEDRLPSAFGKLNARWDKLNAQRVKLDAQKAKLCAQWWGGKLYSRGAKLYAQLEKLDSQWDKLYAREANLIERHRPELEALHTELCPDCTWDGETIFTRKDENRNWY